MKKSNVRFVKCVICENKAKANLLCKTCLSNPFRVEELRTILAKQNKLQVLSSTYVRKLAEINNLNTGEFWDQKLSKNKGLATQDGMTRERVKSVFNFIPKTPSKILDIGAGSGFIEELLSELDGYQLYGTDISKYAVKKLKEKFKGNFKLQSIYNLNFKKKYFDVVLTLEVMEHIPPSKTLSVFRAINSILKEKGLFIVSVPLNEDLENMSINSNGHLRTYSKELLIAELKLTGFRMVKFKYLFAFSSLYSFKNLLAKIFRTKWRPNNLIVLAQKV